MQFLDLVFLEKELFEFWCGVLVDVSETDQQIVAQIQLCKFIKINFDWPLFYFVVSHEKFF